MLTLDNIEVVYSGIIHAVKGVSLEVPDNSIVTLLGANGAGKTSILRAISGTLSMQRGKLAGGTIQLNGKRIDKLESYQIIRLGLAHAPEGRRIFADLTVEENLRAGGYSQRDKAAQRKTYDQVMTLFPQLAERSKQAAGYLSGGEQQMLSIGRALMARPHLLLMDEPSLGLGPMIVQQIRDIILQINAEGTAVLLVEQNASMALSIAHYGYILELGKISHAGPSAELRANEDVKRYYLGLSEAETKRDFSRFKDKNTRLAEKAQRKVML
ncbi:MAG TPA: ABC transporter ATP-binding protein [Chloroflexia bacterium]|nr:ABC transporter ATP-binding protein [Chloroflexia bacterium]